jgi:branched-chain amino acid transport system ATP-binding protein
MLRLRNVDLAYGRIQAVRRASLHVGKGEIVALIGANGAGKTTMLTAVSGLMRPASGSIEFDGRDITRAQPDAIVRAGVSHVPEGRLVFGPMTVEDNLLLGSFTRHRLGRRTDVRPELEQVYTMFPRLEERRLQAAGTLSGGEQQMVAIGRALMAKPKMLLLDEPGMGLAPTVTKEIFRYILKLRDALGLTVLLVEQNARAALRIADRGYVLETGRILLQGPAGELLANNDVQRAYLGRDLDREVQPEQGA